MEKNQLTGSIPAIGQLTQLCCHFSTSSGTILMWEGRYLNQNQLSGTIPETIGNLTTLKVLYVQRMVTQYVDLIPSDNLSRSSRNLGRNQLSGPLPELIGQLKSLQIMYAPGTGIRVASDR